MSLPMETEWFRQTTLRPGIIQITEPHVHPYFRANMWLVEGRESDLLVDFGMGLSPLTPTLRRDAVKPLVAVATHAHVDHVGAFHEFEHRIGPARSAESFNDLPDDITLAHLFRGLADPLMVLPHNGWQVLSYRPRPAPLTLRVGEGDVIEAADRRFTVLELPGHSPDSIALFEEKTGILIAGDAIYSGTLVDDLPGSDPLTYVDTMRRLAELPVDMVLPGHNAPLNRAIMREIAERYIRCKEEKETAVLAD